MDEGLVSEGVGAGVEKNIDAEGDGIAASGFRVLKLLQTNERGRQGIRPIAKSMLLRMVIFTCLKLKVASNEGAGKRVHLTNNEFCAPSNCLICIP